MVHAMKKENSDGSAGVAPVPAGGATVNNSSSRQQILAGLTVVYYHDRIGT